MMTEYFFTCPYCWQRISILLDTGVERLQGIEDCEVCCRPIEVDVTMNEGRVVSFSARKTD